jgi:hypothetical protein
MKKLKEIVGLPPMTDQELEAFWEKNEPEDFTGWREGELKFRRPPKRLMQLRLDPGDAMVIDRESKRSGIDRAQLVRSWVREKIREIQSQKES